MRPFEKRFNKSQDDFDRDMTFIQRLSFVVALLAGVVGLALAGSLIWLIITLVKYFGG